MPNARNRVRDYTLYFYNGNTGWFCRTNRKLVECHLLCKRGTPDVVYRWRHFDDVCAVGRMPLCRHVRHSNDRSRVQILITIATVDYTHWRHHGDGGTAFILSLQELSFHWLQPRASALSHSHGTKVVFQILMGFPWDPRAHGNSRYRLISNQGAKPR